jgi:hypothetical protein
MGCESPPRNTRAAGYPALAQNRQQGGIDMRTRITVGVVVLVGIIGAVSVAARVNNNVGTDKQWTVTNFPDPVLVKDTVVMGPVLIVHDSAKMARGEACTTFYRFRPGTGPQEELVSFHCRPRQGASVEETTFTLQSTGPGCKRLVEYQIGGDAEAHGVPAK